MWFITKRTVHPSLQLCEAALVHWISTRWISDNLHAHKARELQPTRGTSSRVRIWAWEGRGEGGAEFCSLWVQWEGRQGVAGPSGCCPLQALPWGCSRGGRSREQRQGQHAQGLLLFTNITSKLICSVLQISSTPASQVRSSLVCVSLSGCLGFAIYAFAYYSLKRTHSSPRILKQLGSKTP